jgi:hypothetical protein
MGKQVPFIGSSQSMFCFVQRTPGYLDKATIILKATSTRAFGNIGPNAVRCSNELLSRGKVSLLTTDNEPELTWKLIADSFRYRLRAAFG